MLTTARLPQNKGAAPFQRTNCCPRIMKQPVFFATGHHMIGSSKQRGITSMANALWNRVTSTLALSRRALFQRGGILAAAQALGTSIEQTVHAAPMQLGNIYRSIG